MAMSLSILGALSSAEFEVKDELAFPWSSHKDGQRGMPGSALRDRVSREYFEDVLMCRKSIANGEVVMQSRNASEMPKL